MLNLLVLFVLLSIIYAIYIWYRYGYWARRGVPSPPVSHWFLGHAVEVQENRASVDNIYNIGKKMNTKTFGLYEGGRRTLVTSDLDIINDVFVKKFEHFHGRKLPMFVAIDQDTDLTNADVLGSQGLRWKRLRSIMNPSFTTGKLRQFEPVILDSVNRFTDLLREKSGTELDIVMPLNRLTMDVIYRIAFGRRDSHLYGDIPESIVHIARTVFQGKPVAENIVHSFFTGTYDFLPVTRYLFNALASLVKDPFIEVKAELQKELEKRYKMMENEEDLPRDYIQMFIESQADEKETEEFAQQMTSSLERTHLKVNRKMTAEEIIGQCTIFLLAGYDTTANGIAYFVNEMAENPDIQQKLYEEITAVCPTKDDLTSENIQNIEYLEYCLKENLRKNPHVGLLVARKCTETCTVASGLQIEKGTDVRANVKMIHYDEKLWGENPEKFDPSRFDADKSIDRPQLAYLAFGFGPRMCIGMRLALLEERITIIRILQEFRIEKVPNFEMKSRGLVVTQPDELRVRLISRHID